MMMGQRLIASLTVAVLLGAVPTIAFTADESKVKSAARQVETGAKRIGDGQLGTGVEETAKGVGHTVVEGAKFGGEKVKESGQAAAPPAKSAWQHLKEGSVKASADAFGSSVKRFFTRMFTN